MNAASAVLFMLLESASGAVQGGPTVNESTGDLTYRYEFALPRARGRHQPALALVHSSAANQDIGYGHGWVLSTTYIEIDTRGSPNHPTLWLVSGSERKLLVSFGAKYRPEVEDAFFEVTASQTNGVTTYTATDASGSTYSFMRTVGGRAYLTKVQDLDYNVTEYAYTTPSIEAPDEIRYNIYPPGASTPSFASKVRLVWESDGSLAPAAVAGVVVDRSHRLDRIVIMGPTAAGSEREIRRWEIEYTTSGPPWERSVETITEQAGGLSLPPTTFLYDRSAFALDVPTTVQPPENMSAIPLPPGATAAGGDRNADWIDLDGDGLTDWVWSSSASTQALYYWARNVTPIGSISVQFEPVQAISTSFLPTPAPARVLRDFDGDGVTDLISTEPGIHTIHRGIRGASFSFDPIGITLNVSAWIPVPINGAGQFDDPPTRVVTDINGDGVLDYARTEFFTDCVAGTCPWSYALTVLDIESRSISLIEQPDTLQVIPSGQWFPIIAGSTALNLWLGFDINGDSLADGVWLTGATHGGAYNTVDGDWQVALSVGAPSVAPSLRYSWGNAADLAGYADQVETLMQSSCGEVQRDDGRYTKGDLVDFNGDGRPDYYRSGGIAWNTGRGFALPRVPTGTNFYARYGHWSGEYEWTKRENGQEVYCYVESMVSPYKGQFMDFNGDGIPDFLRTLSDVPPAQLEYFRGMNANGVARPILLREIRTPDGGVFQVDYVNSSVFGAPSRSRKPVVVAIRTAGQNVAPNAAYYWYSGPASGSLWYNPAKLEDRGFTESWMQDETTRAVRHTVWSTESHAYFGRPDTITMGMPVGRALGTPATLSNPGGPPATTAFSRQSITYDMKRLDAGAGGCIVAPDPAASDYPLRVIQTRVVASNYYATTEASAQSQTACEDVDAYGNVLATTTSSVLGTAGPSLVTRQFFTGSTACKNVPLELRVTRSVGSVTLAEEVKTYDYGCRLTSEYSPGDATPRTDLKTYSYAGPFYQLDASTMGGTTKRLVYDAFSLNVIEERTEDALTALSTTYTYDPATRLRLSVVGPKVVKRNGSSYTSTDLVIARYYSYDALGRTLAVAKADFKHGTVENPALVPATATEVTEAVEAYAYLDAAVPRATVAYRFSVARTYLLAGAVPETDDVAKAISYRDGFGRELQVRERLGGGGSADPRAGVTQSLNGYKVSKALFYDGAGRVRVSLEPFYDGAGEGFVDYGVVGIPETRGTVTTYDDQPASFSYQRRGQPWCSSYQFIAGTLPGIPGNCSSDSSHSAGFRLATETRYTSRSVSQRGPYAGLFVATEITPPALAARVELLGPGGEGLGSIDGDGNYTWVERDAMGREVASWREGASRSISTPIPVSTIAYNKAGQVKATWDANYPNVSRTSRYDEAGRLVYVTTDPATGEGIEYVYEDGDLGRITEVREVTDSGGSAVVKVVARNHYDVPYLIAGIELKYAGGKLAWTENGETKIVYSYDSAGRVERRDQFFTKLDATKRFTMSSTYGDDGRVRTAEVVNTYDVRTFLYEVDYDSAGRPVGLRGKLGSQSPFEQLYEAVTPTGSSTGSYDALGRVPTMRADGSRVVSARTYNRYSGALEGECKRFDAGVVCTGTGLDPAKDIYRTDQAVATYVGGRLEGYLDGATQTTYQNLYLPSGRLQSVAAQPGQSTPGALSQDWLETFAFNGVGNLGSVTREQNKYRPATARPYRSVAEQYHPASPAPGQVLDRVESIGRTVRDAGGALVNEPGAGTERYGYDLLKHLVAVTRSAGESESLSYAPGGELLYRQVGEKFVFYVGEYATVTARGAVGCSSSSSCTPQPGTVEVDAHVIFAGTRVASVKPSRTLYYYRTRLGSVIATSLNGGRPGAAYRYTPYGEVEHAVGETEETRSELGYTNALRLSGSLLYLKARVYDTQARVFIQADEVDRLRYAYVQGDPVNSSDPTGLEPRADNGSRKLVLGGAAFGWIITYDKDNKIVKTEVYDLAVPTERETFNNTQTALQIEAQSQREPNWFDRKLSAVVGTVRNWWNEADEAGHSKAAAAGAKAVGGLSAGFWRGAGDGSEETREGIARNADRTGSELGAAAYNGTKDVALSALEGAAAGKAVGVLGVILQNGGHTISKATARALNKKHGLNLHPREWGDALEELKHGNFLPNNYHGQIHLDGAYKSPTGEEIDNILNYLP